MLSLFDRKFFKYLINDREPISKRQEKKVVFQIKRAFVVKYHRIEPTVKINIELFECSLKN